MNQNNWTIRRLTTGGMMTALGVLVLVLTSLSPGARLGLCALAGVLAAIVIIRAGFGTAVLTVAATAVLALLLVPNKGIALAYACFFGPYALVKNAVERLHRLPLEWLLKGIYCVALSSLLYWLSSDVLGLLPDILARHFMLFVPAVLVVFLAYDLVFSKLIVWFCYQVR